jgi:multicomponent Na+:H+ antiporter subunit E
VSLSAVWLLWSGYWDPHDDYLILGFGLASVLGVMAISSRMDRVAQAPRSYRLGLRPLLYLPWLAVEIVKANIDVARIILSPTLPISPRLIRVPATQDTAVGQVVYANSITLTPGTISLDVRNNQILIHALTKEAADGVLSGDMGRRVAALEAQD